MSPISLILFALMWFVIVYLLDSLLQRRFKTIDIKQATLYFWTVALIGVFGEIFLDTVYHHFVGTPLWRYNILPIHNSYTSTFAVMVWGIYGFHLYMLHDTLAKWSIYKTKHLAFILSVEALIIESLLTISSKLLLGEYMYYYYPGDLWHVTTIQNMPFYFICGVVILKTIKRFKQDPMFFSLMSASLLTVVVFLV